MLLVLFGVLVAYLLTEVFLASGLSAWLAYALPLVPLTWWGFAINARRTRYSCASCGIDFPRDMVRRTQAESRAN